MLEAVLVACAHAPAVASTLVVAGDPHAAALAREIAPTPIDVVVQRSPRDGLHAALALAEQCTAHAPATLVVAADLPLARGEDVQAVCDAGGPAPCVVLVATADGGTGALLRRPGGVIPSAYGQASALAHLALARAAGIRGVRLDLPRLALDVDTPDDLRAARLAAAALG